jgi:hypothetical protein
VEGYICAIQNCRGLFVKLQRSARVDRYKKDLTRAGIDLGRWMQIERLTVAPAGLATQTGGERRRRAARAHRSSSNSSSWWPNSTGPR